MKHRSKIFWVGGGLVALAGTLYFALHALSPKYKVESNGYFYRVVEKTGLTYSFIPDHSPRVSDRFVNQFFTYEEAQQLIKWLQRHDRDKTWRSVSGPVKRDEVNVLVPLDPETAVPVPASKCVAKSTKEFVVGKTSYRDILGDWWVYTGANPDDVNDYKNWKPTSR